MGGATDWLDLSAMRHGADAVVHYTFCFSFGAYDHRQSVALPAVPQPAFSTVTERGLAIIAALLQAAREQQIITDVDVDVVTHTLLDGLLSYVIPSLVLGCEQAQPPLLDRADAVVEMIMRALGP